MTPPPIMTLPDPPTITALATLIGVFFTGVVALLNAIFSRRSHNQLREQVGDVKQDTKLTVTNTNGQLASMQAENKALLETKRMLEDQMRQLMPRPSRATDPVPLVPGTVEPDAGAVHGVKSHDPV